MEKVIKEQLIKLFNKGDLTIVNAYYYHKHGYAIICHDGKVVDIIKEAKK